MKQSNARVSSRSAASSKHGVRQQRKPCHQSSDSFLVRPSHSYSMNAATTVKECQRRASTGWQCNRERAWRTSCAQAGTACTVFSLWSATNATPAKQEWQWSPSFKSRTVRAAACKTLCRGTSVIAGKPARTALQWSRRDSTKVVTSLAVTSRPSWRRSERNSKIQQLYLQRQTNTKSYMIYRSTPYSVTLDDPYARRFDV